MLSSKLAMSFSHMMSVMTMSHNNPRQEKVLVWLLNCSWNDLSSSQKENCMAKMSYSG